MNWRTLSIRSPVSCFIKHLLQERQVSCVSETNSVVKFLFMHNHGTTAMINTEWVVGRLYFAPICFPIVSKSALRVTFSATTNLRLVHRSGVSREGGSRLRGGRTPEAGHGRVIRREANRTKSLVGLPVTQLPSWGLAHEVSSHDPHRSRTQPSAYHRACRSGSA